MKSSLSKGAQGQQRTLQHEDDVKGDLTGKQFQSLLVDPGTGSRKALLSLKQAQLSSAPPPLLLSLCLHTASLQTPRYALAARACLMLLTTLTSYIVPLCSWLSGHVANPGHDHHNTLPSSSNLNPTPTTRQSAAGSVGGGASMGSRQGGAGVGRLHLRQLHAVSEGAKVIFHDVDQERYRTWAEAQQQQQYMQTSLTGHSGADSDVYYYMPATRRVKTYRPPSFEAHAAARTRSMRFGGQQRSALVQELGWEEEEIEAPDVERRDVLLLLAKIANNAYVEPGDPYWYDLGEGWNNVRSRIPAFLHAPP